MGGRITSGKWQRLERDKAVWKVALLIVHILDGVDGVSGDLLLSPLIHPNPIPDAVNTVAQQTLQVFIALFVQQLSKYPPHEIERKHNRWGTACVFSIFFQLSQQQIWLCLL